MNVPVLREYILLAVIISTGYEPGYRYCLNSHNPSYNLSHNLQKSLKNPKSCQHTNSRINSTKTQHHLHDHTMTSSKPASNMTWWGDIPKLTHNNYDEWKDNMILILSAIREYAIISGEDSEPQPVDFHHNENYDDWKPMEVEDASTIRLSCSPYVLHIFKDI